MFPVQRSELILNKVNTFGKVYVSDLVEELNVSDVTIRKDLIKLADQGLIIKTHGGAIRKSHAKDETVITDNQKIKDQLALTTYKKIKKSDTIFLGSGYTCTMLANHIKKEDNLCVITNNIEASLILKGKCRTLILLGGEVYHFNSYTFTGSTRIEEYLSRYNINLMITSCSGVTTDSGVSFTTEVNYKVMTAIIKSAKSWYLMVDYSKIGKVSPYKVADIEDVTTIITDNINEENLVVPNIERVTINNKR